MVDKFAQEPSVHKPAGAAMSLLSRVGPEVPPDVAGAATGKRLFRPFSDEPTQTLPIVAARPAPPRRRPPPPSVAARAVIIYESLPGQPWRLWVFTAMLVALTAGVILGQTVADQPASRSAASTQVGTAYGDPAALTPSPSGPAAPTAGQRVTAPLGSAKTRLLEITGTSAVLHVRSANLGDLLYNIAAVDSSAVPKLVNTARGPRLELVRTGVAGTVGADIQINAKVSWTVRLTGWSAEQNVDMRAGGLARLDLAGGTPRAQLQLPKPKGTVLLSITGAVTDLNVLAGTGTPVRLRLGKGADVATIDGTKYGAVKIGKALASTGWKSARNRYDVTTSATVGSVSVDHR